MKSPGGLKSLVILVVVLAGILFSVAVLSPGRIVSFVWLLFNQDTIAMAGMEVELSTDWLVVTRDSSRIHLCLSHSPREGILFKDRHVEENDLAIACQSMSHKDTSLTLDRVVEARIGSERVRGLRFADVEGDTRYREAYTLPDRDIFILILRNEESEDEFGNLMERVTFVARQQGK